MGSMVNNPSMMQQMGATTLQPNQTGDLTRQMLAGYLSGMGQNLTSQDYSPSLTPGPGLLARLTGSVPSGMDGMMAQGLRFALSPQVQAQAKMQQSLLPKPPRPQMSFKVGDIPQMVQWPSLWRQF